MSQLPPREFVFVDFDRLLKGIVSGLLLGAGAIVLLVATRAHHADEVAFGLLVLAFVGAVWCAVAWWASRRQVVCSRDADGVGVLQIDRQRIRIVDPSSVEIGIYEYKHPRSRKLVRDYLCAIFPSEHGALLLNELILVDRPGNLPSIAANRPRLPRGLRSLSVYPGPLVEILKTVGAWDHRRSG